MDCFVETKILQKPVQMLSVHWWVNTELYSVYLLSWASQNMACMCIQHGTWQHSLVQLALCGGGCMWYDVGMVYSSVSLENVCLRWWKNSGNKEGYCSMQQPSIMAEEDVEVLQLEDNGTYNWWKSVLEWKNIQSFLSRQRMLARGCGVFRQFFFHAGTHGFQWHTAPSLLVFVENVLLPLCMYLSELSIPATWSEGYLLPSVAAS